MTIRIKVKDLIIALMMLIFGIAIDVVLYHTCNNMTEVWAMAAVIFLIMCVVLIKMNRWFDYDEI